MNSSTYALMVRAPDETLSDALSAALPVVHCPVSDDGWCPAMSGETCELRANARLTVVYVEPDDDTPRMLTCAAQEPPVLAVIGGLHLEPRVFGRFGIVGEQSGPLALLSAVASLVDDVDEGCS